MATLAKLIPVAVTVPITPLMLNAKAYCVQRLNWSPDVRWEDLIDTIFYHYFKSIGVILQGWYEEEHKDREGSPKPAGGKDQGNGNSPIDYDKLAKLVTQQIVEMAQSGKLRTTGAS